MKIKPRYLVIKTFESNQRKEAVDIWISAVVFLVTDMLDRGRKYRMPNDAHSAKSHPAHLPILPAFLLHNSLQTVPSCLHLLATVNLNTQRCLRPGDRSQCTLKTDGSRNTGEPADEGGRVWIQTMSAAFQIREHRPLPYTLCRGRWDCTTLKMVLWMEEYSTGLKPVCPLWFCHLANSVMVQLYLKANRQTRSYMAAPLILQLCTELTDWEKIICTGHCSSQLCS